VFIKGELELRNLSLRKLAAREGVSHQAMSSALIAPSSHLQAVLAQALGLTVHQLFPEWYDEAGVRLGRTRSPQRSTGRRAGNVESGRAA
jgi:lambda repressor-like predicted transcriptional regulator